MADYYGAYRGYMDDNFDDSQGNKRSDGPSPFWYNTKPPSDGEKSNDLRESEWWRFVRGEHSPCPQCKQWVTLNAEGTTKCWNCENEIEGPGVAPIFPNFSVYVPGAGPRKKGWTVTCRCYRGNVLDITKDGESPKQCVTCKSAEEYLEWIIGDFESKMGRKPGKDDKEFWRKALSRRPRLNSAHQLVRIGYFHDVQIVTEDGKKYQKTLPCLKGQLGRNKRMLKCPHCESGVERYWGERGYWNPPEPKGGRGHLATLQSYIRENLASTCLNCAQNGEEGIIQAASYTCAECGHMVLDCYGNGVTEEAIEQAATGKMNCSHCGHEKLVEHIQCTRHQGEDVYEGCDNPVRTTIFDVNFEVCRRGSGLDSALVIKGHTFDDPFPEDADFDRLFEPFDFRFLADIKTDTQAKFLHIDNPFSGEEGKRGAAATTEYSG